MNRHFPVKQEDTHLPFSKEEKTKPKNPLDCQSTGMLKGESILTEHQLIWEDYCPIQKSLKDPKLLVSTARG